MLWKNACNPGTCSAVRRSRPITTCAESRSCLGFSEMKKRP